MGGREGAGLYAVFPAKYISPASTLFLFGSGLAGLGDLILYSRTYCHLCDEMLAALEALRGEFVFKLAVVDVDADPLLEAKFDELVPVLAGEDGQVICHYFLDVPKVREYLARFQ